MAKIYKRSDRIKVNIGDVTVVIAPLSVHDKTEAQRIIANGSINQDYALTQQGLILLLKCSVKEIIGLEDSNGEPYKLQFEGDRLTDDCIDDLFNIQLHEKLIMICTSLVRGIPSEFKDEKGNKIEGVEIVSSASEGAPAPK
jgi:hypothetical protein